MKQNLAARLVLALVSVAWLSGCRPATPAQAPPAVPALAPEDARKLTDSRLKQLGLAAMIYAERHNEVMPDMTSPQAFKQDITPYLHEKGMSEGEKLLVQADTDAPFQPNAFFSKKNIGSSAPPYDDPRSYVMLYQASPSPNMTRGLIFGDGHLERIGENDWPAIKLKSKIS